MCYTNVSAHVSGVIDILVQGEDQASRGTVHPLLLDQLPVGLHGKFHKVLVCIWNNNIGK